jgi:hypothetical protein
LGTIAVACATANVVGGFLITDQILAMFRHTREGKPEVKEGATSFLLSMAMSKAMNRSFSNVLFGAFGSEEVAGASPSATGGEMSAISAEDAALRLAHPEKTIMVPGYGLAVA